MLRVRNVAVYLWGQTNTETMKVETTENGNQVRTELLFNMPKVTPYVTDEHKMGYIYSVHSYPSYPNMLYVSKREYNNCGHFSGYNHVQFPIEKASSFDMEYISKLVSQVV